MPGWQLSNISEVVQGHASDEYVQLNLDIFLLIYQ